MVRNKVCNQDGCNITLRDFDPDFCYPCWIVKAFVTDKTSEEDYNEKVNEFGMVWQIEGMKGDNEDKSN